MLAVSSYPTRTSVVIRGKYILQNILGTPPPPPPPDVPALDEEARRHQRVAAPADGEAPVELHVRVVPLAHGPARVRPRELRRDWQVADAGRRIPCRFERRAAEREVVLDARRDAPDSGRDAARLLARADREDADVRAGPRPRALRQADGAGHHDAAGRLGYGFQRLVLEVVRSLPFQSRRAEAVKPVAVAANSRRAARSGVAQPMPATRSAATGARPSRRARRGAAPAPAGRHRIALRARLGRARARRAAHRRSSDRASPWRNSTTTPSTPARRPGASSRRSTIPFGRDALPRLRHRPDSPWQRDRPGRDA